MARKIQELRNSTEDTILPVTVAGAVFASDGRTMQEIVDDGLGSFRLKQEEVTILPSEWIIDDVMGTHKYVFRKDYITENTTVMFESWTGDDCHYCRQGNGYAEVTNIDRDGRVLECYPPDKEVIVRFAFMG